MEDLWKVTRIDYRIATIADRSAYAEMVRRYRQEEDGSARPPARQETASDEPLLKVNAFFPLADRPRLTGR